MDNASRPDKFLQSLQKKQKQKQKSMLDFELRFVQSCYYMHKLLHFRMFSSFSINPLSLTKSVWTFFYQNENAPICPTLTIFTNVNLFGRLF